MPIDEFEQAFFDTFPQIRKETGVNLFPLYPPVRSVGSKGRSPIFVATGQSYFDVAGWMPCTHETQTFARTIGIELKRSTNRLTALPIRKPGTPGWGLKLHQLEALAALSRDGGLAAVLWCNAGEIGVCKGEALEQAFIDYLAAHKAEEAGRVAARGSRSLSWNCFDTVDITDPKGVVEAL